MSERYIDMTAEERRAQREQIRMLREKRRKMLILAIVVCAVILVAGVVVIFALPGSNTNETKPPVLGDTTPNTNGSGNNSNETTGQTETQAPTETTQFTVDTAEVEKLVADAEFIAAGYDYQKAITMLTEYEHYDLVPELATKVAEYQKLDSELVVYAKPETVTHIFFHSLIVDTARAFDGDTDSGGYHTYMTTIDEFNAILEEMYKRNYVLITPYDLAYETTDENGNTVFTYGQIRLPEGKIPFIMSQDDVNYYSYMISSGKGAGETPYWVDEGNDGFASRIIIGEDGYPTCEYVDAEGNLHVGDYDLVPLLEKFIQEHPDFSYHGARAVLAVTGYEGVFGYRTKPTYEPNMGSEAYAAEVAAAKEVTQCLKDHGWIIASHSYGHYSYGVISTEKMIIDSDKWEDTVQPVVGDTDIIIYPNGSDVAGVEKYTFSNQKFAALYEDGYRYFFNVDSTVYWNQMGENYFRGGRRNLDGYRMYHHPHKVDDLFDVADVWDDSRPTAAPAI